MQSRLLTPVFSSRSEVLHSASLLNPYATIPEEEFLGFLEDLPSVGAAISELEGRQLPERWPAE